MSKETWEKIYTTTSAATASIIEGMLIENEIPVQVLNKQDSSYLVFGEISIFVPINFVSAALGFIGDAFNNSSIENNI